MSEKKTPKATTEPRKATKPPIAKIHEDDKFEFKFSGSIVKKYVNNSSATLTLAIPSVEGRRVITDYPRIHFYGPTVKEAAYFHETESVIVTGTMQNTKLKPDETILRQHQTYVGTSIETVSLGISEMLKANEDCDDIDMTIKQGVNEIEFSGVVESAYMARPGQMRITFTYSPDMKRMYYLQAIVFDSTPNAFDKIRIGQKIHAKGYCGTRNAQDRNNKMIHYEDLVITQILD